MFSAHQIKKNNHNLILIKFNKAWTFQQKNLDYARILGNLRYSVVKNYRFIRKIPKIVLDSLTHEWQSG